MKGLYVLCLASLPLISCGNSEKQEKIERLHEIIDESTQSRNEWEDKYQRSNDNDEIDENVSNFMGAPVTNGQVRVGAIQEQERTIERAQNELDRLRDE